MQLQPDLGLLTFCCCASALTCRSTHTLAGCRQTATTKQTTTRPTYNSTTCPAAKSLASSSSSSKPAATAAAARQRRLRQQPAAAAVSGRWCRRQLAAGRSQLLVNSKWMLLGRCWKRKLRTHFWALLVQPQVGFDAGTFNSGLGGFCCISRPWHWPAFGLFDSLYTLLVPSAASSRSLAAVGEVQVDAARALLQAELKGAFLGTAGAAAGLYEADWGCGCAFVILLCQGHSTGQPWI